MVNTANSPDRIAEPHTREVRLSRRQAECLSWVEEGKSAVDIGGILGLSARTVEEYISKACEKLGVRTRVQAVVRARRLGLLEDALT